MSFFLGPISVQRCRVLIRLEHWEEKEEEAQGLMSNEDEGKRKEKKKKNKKKKKKGWILSF